MTPEIENLVGELDGIALKHQQEFGQRSPGFHPQNLSAGLMLLPQTTDEIQKIVSTCNELGIAIVTHGGRTGLSGAAVSQADQIILDTAKLNRIIEIDVLGGTATVECGVTLESLEAAANQVGLSCGIDLAARGSATIGGMVSTNAGGIEAFRNGVMRHRVLGLEAVMANGELLQDLKKVNKANEGYDVKQLLIGAEGTLGVITKIVLSLVPKSASPLTAMVSCATPDQAVALFRDLRNHPEIDLLSAEVMWPQYAHIVAGHTGLQSVLAFEQSSDALFLVVETARHSESDEECVNVFLMESMENGIINNVVIAKNDSERSDIWRIREDSFVVDDVCPGGLWFDMSVPLNHMANYADRLFEKLHKLNPALRCFLFAHLGDGNFHATISGVASISQFEADIKAAVYDGLSEIGGSYSAEHGIGLDKICTLQKYTCPQKIKTMKVIKSLFDPNHIFNPGKVI